MDREELIRRVHELRWYHTIDLGQGVVTPGDCKTIVSKEVLPDFTGRSVIDIGAWDGLYSFIAEQSGASRVVALDHYIWGVDLQLRGEYWDKCVAAGVLPDHTRDTIDFWDPSLPRKRGFDLAKEALGSRVEAIVSDFMTTDLNDLGVFDIALYLGVLYHMQEPLTALVRLRKVTREVAVIETEAIHLPGHSAAPLLEFEPGDELRRGDYGNWYAGTEAALHAMCKAAGFASVVTKRGPPDIPSHRRKRSSPDLYRYRAVLHAFP